MEASKFNARPDTWSAVDGLGRFLPENDLVGDPRQRFVGIFFWTWHNRYDEPENAVNTVWETPNRGRGTVNMQQVMDETPEAKNDYDHPAWRGMGSGNGIGTGHWNEPIYGYYFSSDEWVLRRQAELLANAGVDAVVFDNTNGTDTWEAGYMAAGRTFSRAKADGIAVPGIAFLLPLHMGDPNNAARCAVQLREIYQKVYRKGLFRDVWFCWKGKPLVMAFPDALDPTDPLDAEILDFFTFRPCQPSYYDGQVRPDLWGWLSLYPQQVYRNADGTPEQITVGVAQNTNAYAAEAKVPNVMNGYGIYGRSYTSRGFDPRPDAKLWGANFQEQWERALRVDPEFVFVTGWNEWISGHKRIRCGVPNGLSDQFDDEHSRDIEPTRGALRDHYYYQLCANIRRFKGVRPQMEPAAATDLDVHSPAAAWEDKGTTFVDHKKDLSPRDAVGYYHYASDTGRNAIRLSRVSHDAENVYFEAVCQEPITPPDGKNWMRLLIRTMQDGPSWEGFQYMVNRLAPGEQAYLERSLGGWKWSVAARCRWHMEGCRLVLAVPRKALGTDTKKFKLYFKWCDNNLAEGDILSLYTDGDASPGGRFTFCYKGGDA